MATYTAFDPSAYLDNDEVIGEFLIAAAEDPDPEVFIAALGDVAKALKDAPDPPAIVKPTPHSP